MPRRTVALTYNVLGQTLELFVKNGRPSSATFAVYRQYDVTDATPEFSGAASVDSPNTTLNGSAGPSQADPNRVPLASVAGIAAGKRYLIAQNALQEWLDIVEVGATYVRARHPLQNDYTTGATFQSTYLSAAVDATFIQDLNKLSDLVDTAPDYRVKWTITIGGVSLPVYSFFDVVRAAVGHDVELSDIDLAAPGVIDSMPVQYRAEGGRPLIDRAWSSVRAHFMALRLDVNAIREAEVIDELVILRAVKALAEGGWAPLGVDKTEYLRTARENYNTFVETHFQVTLKHAVQEQGAAFGASRSNSLPSWSK